MQRRSLTRFLTLSVALAALTAAAGRAADPPGAGGQAAQTVDHRFAPRWWQTSTCLPDDWQKTLVGKEGTLLYDFPGKVFAADDPPVRGNMAMLRAVECEGLVRDTGWVHEGVWNYFASFYAHGWLWLGDGRKAAETLYAFANHASPLLCWREEQMPLGKGDAVCGDMPHNWGSAEFLRLVRHLLVLERGDELHLFEGLPREWIAPGRSVRVRDALTEFGPVSLELATAADGKTARLVFDPPKRIVLHLGGWSGGEGTLELPTGSKTEKEIPIRGR